MLSLLSTLVYPRLDPVIFHLGPLAIRWYGLAYLMGFVMAYAVLRQLIRRGALRITAVELDSLIPWLVVGVVFGGRLGWWLFYHHNIHQPEPWYEPLAMWHGGMSFHGGLLGVSLAMVGWAYKHRAPLNNLADAAALVTPFGLFFGRIANFINAELVGRPSTVPWAMIFPGDNIPRHPSQLYEAFLEGPLLLAAVWIIWRIFRPTDGRTFAWFVILYGLFRFGVEFTREPDVQLGFIAMGWLTMGQLLSLILALVGVVLLVLAPRIDAAWQRLRPRPAQRSQTTRS